MKNFGVYLIENFLNFSKNPLLLFLALSKEELLPKNQERAFFWDTLYVPKKVKRNIFVRFVTGRGVEGGGLRGFEKSQTASIKGRKGKLSERGLGALSLVIIKIKRFSFSERIRAQICACSMIRLRHLEIVINIDSVTLVLDK